MILGRFQIEQLLTRVAPGAYWRWTSYRRIGGHSRGRYYSPADAAQAIGVLNALDSTVIATSDTGYSLTFYPDGSIHHYE